MTVASVVHVTGGLVGWATPLQARHPLFAQRTARFAPRGSYAFSVISCVVGEDDIAERLIVGMRKVIDRLSAERRKHAIESIRRVAPAIADRLEAPSAGKH
jgi:hypothetical protein